MLDVKNILKSKLLLPHKIHISTGHQTPLRKSMDKKRPPRMGVNLRQTSTLRNEIKLF